MEDLSSVDVLEEAVPVAKIREIPGYEDDGLERSDLTISPGKKRPMTPKMIEKMMSSLDRELEDGYHLGENPHQEAIDMHKATLKHTIESFGENNEINRTIDQVRAQLAAEGEASRTRIFQPTSLEFKRPISQSVPTKEAKPSFWSKAGKTLSKLKFWGKKEDPVEAEDKRLFERALSLDAFAERRSIGLGLTLKEQSGIMGYLNKHPDMAREKSVELLAMIGQFREENREAFLAAILDSIPYGNGGREEDNLFQAFRDGLPLSDSQGNPISLEAFMTPLLMDATTDPSVAEFLPLVPWSEVESVALRASAERIEKGTGKVYDLATPREYQRRMSNPNRKK